MGTLPFSRGAEQRRLPSTGAWRTGQDRTGQDRTAHVSHICSFNLLLIFFKNEGFKLLKFSMNIKFYKKCLRSQCKIYQKVSSKF
jgi:hypothetical protein